LVDDHLRNAARNMSLFFMSVKPANIWSMDVCNQL
jgi:hypothetical protein